MIGVATALVEELPPRARRILSWTRTVGDHEGTTSACAENTWDKFCIMASLGNYLRVRGEYHFPFQKYPPTVELPPRARRILTQSQTQITDRGTTSACAENTPGLPRCGLHKGNYLRVRGEYSKPPSTLIASMELPPRARRIRRMRSKISMIGGTTSACAENTRLRILSPAASGNYLRVRGEYAFGKVLVNRSRELPPRARRIHRDECPTVNQQGTTSACAENTLKAVAHHR